MERVIQWLDANGKKDPSPGNLAQALGLSQTKIQGLCKRWAGVTPGQAAEFLTAAYTKPRLNTFALTPLQTCRIKVETVQSGHSKQVERELTIRYGQHASPFGPCLLGRSERGICYLGFGEGNLPDLQQRWPRAALTEDMNGTADSVEQIFQTTGRAEKNAIRLFLKGTDFQLKVWKALLRIPAGAVISYGELARRIQHPGASRAVGKAVGANPIACLIPCHRVLQTSGAMYHYHWGTVRKKAILLKEWGGLPAQEGY